MDSNPKFYKCLKSNPNVGLIIYTYLYKSRTIAKFEKSEKRINIKGKYSINTENKEAK